MLSFSDDVSGEVVAQTASQIVSIFAEHPIWKSSLRILSSTAASKYVLPRLAAFPSLTFFDMYLGPQVVPSDLVPLGSPLHHPTITKLSISSKGLERGTFQLADTSDVLIRKLIELLQDTDLTSRHFTLALSDWYPRWPLAVAFMKTVQSLTNKNHNFKFKSNSSLDWDLILPFMNIDKVRKRPGNIVFCHSWYSHPSLCV
jgi:hypothetical protein